MQELSYIIIGITLLFLGGKGLIRSCITLAETLGFSTLLISSIVIGFGTSAPELLVSVQAAIEELPEIALGNVIGSNISNTLLVLGMAAVIAPIPCRTKQIKRDAVMCGIASFFITGLSILTIINRLTGLMMLFSLIIGHDRPLMFDVSSLNGC